MTDYEPKRMTEAVEKAAAVSRTLACGSSKNFIGNRRELCLRQIACRGTVILMHVPPDFEGKAKAGSYDLRRPKFRCHLCGERTDQCHAKHACSNGARLGYTAVVMVFTGPNQGHRI